MFLCDQIYVTYIGIQSWSHTQPVPTALLAAVGTVTGEVKKRPKIGHEIERRIRHEIGVEIGHRIGMKLVSELF